MSASTTKRGLGPEKEASLQAIEFETRIDQNGRIFLPKEFQHAYGQSVRLLVLLPEQVDRPPKRRPGSAKDILKIVSEDDEHLDDFKMYMP
jgi:bifunctional DNA-binding transcriptional regulator/antitoxin component of YhaV-PrlF toxin-antitoxin module